MVMVSMSRKDGRGLDMFVKAYVPRTQETFRFDIEEFEADYLRVWWAG